MDMAGESWRVLGDTYCSAWLQRVVLEPDGQHQNGMPCSTKVLMDIKAVVRRLRSSSAGFGKEENEDVSLFLDDDNWSADEKNDGTVELQHNLTYDMACSAVSRTLSLLQVPLEAHESVVEKIMVEASKAEKLCTCYHPGLCKVLHMAAVVDVYVAESDNSTYCEVAKEE